MFNYIVNFLHDGTMETTTEKTRIYDPAPAPVAESFVRRCIDASSEGDGMMLAALFGGTIRYNIDEQCWYIWRAKRGLWERDSAENIFGLVSAVVDEYGKIKNIDAEQQYLEADQTEDEGTGGNNKKSRALRDKQKRLDEISRRIEQLNKKAMRDGCLEFARKFATSSGKNPLSVQSNVFNADPYLLGVRNGVVDLRTGMLLESRPEDMITCQTGCEYIPWEQVPKNDRTQVERFFSDIFDGETEKIDFFQQLAGQALIGKVTNHVFPFLLGSKGRNGKSVLTKIMLAVWGNYGTTVRAEMFFQQQLPSGSAIDPSIMELEGKRLAISSEVEKGAKFSSQRIKLLTGGDHLTGRNPYERIREFVPSHTVFMLGNHEPSAPSGDPAFWDRTLLIKFPVKFVNNPNPEKRERRIDLQMEAKLMGILPAFLAYFVMGCLEYQRNNCKLSPPQSVKQATEDYQEDSDILAQFLEMTTVQDRNAMVSLRLLYTAYHTWYQEHVNSNKKYVPSQVIFARSLRELDEYPKMRKRDGTYFCGIRLNEIWYNRSKDENEISTSVW